MNTLEWKDFVKIELRVGTVIDAKPFPEAKKPAYQVWVDFGPEVGTRKTSAQITDLYTLSELIGKQVVAVVNFPPKQIGPFMSECLITGAMGPNGVSLLTPDLDVPNGTRIG